MFAYFSNCSFTWSTKAQKNSFNVATTNPMAIILIKELLNSSLISSFMQFYGTASRALSGNLPLWPANRKIIYHKLQVGLCIAQLTRGFHSDSWEMRIFLPPIWVTVLFICTATIGWQNANKRRWSTSKRLAVMRWDYHYDDSFRRQSEGGMGVLMILFKDENSSCPTNMTEDIVTVVICTVLGSKFGWIQVWLQFELAKQIFLSQSWMTALEFFLFIIFLFTNSWKQQNKLCRRARPANAFFMNLRQIFPACRFFCNSTLSNHNESRSGKLRLWKWFQIKDVEKSKRGL